MTLSWRNDRHSACWSWAFTSSVSSILWCPKVRHVSAFRSAPSIRKSNSTRPWANFPRRVKNCVSSEICGLPRVHHVSHSMGTAPKGHCKESSIMNRTPSPEPRILISGANGQLGTELAAALAVRYGNEQVVTSDRLAQGRHRHIAHEALDITDVCRLEELVGRRGITQIYHLGAASSAVREHSPGWAWDLNMTGLLNVLEVARKKRLDKVFWP